MAKFFDKHSVKFVNRVDKLFERLCQNPYGGKGLDIKKLKGLKSDFRLRWGRYRFLYTIMEGEKLIYIYKADTRGDTYKGKLRKKGQG